MVELVIKLDDETYKEVIDRTEFDTLVLGIKLIEAVQNGTPLPKGHGNIYDERDLEKLGNVYFQEEVITNDSNIELHLPKFIINAKPIIEADKGEKE